MPEHPVRYDVADGVATIALDDPDTRNSLSDAMLDGLIEAFEMARDDDGVRCAVLTSTHEKVFSSGGKLPGVAAEGPLVHKHFGIGRLPDLVKLIGGLGEPAVLRRHRHRVAGGPGLATAAHPSG